MTAKQVLLKAARIVEKRGWCRWQFESPGGRVCLLGAPDKACGKKSTKESRDLYRKARGAVAVVIGRADVSGWNDEDTRRRRQVIAVLKKAAALK